MQVNKDTVVSIHYTLTNDQGEVLDSSENQDPLVYLHGADNIIPGLENALEGQDSGSDVKVTIAPEEGYGQHSPELIQDVPKSAFQGVDEIEPGMTFQAQTDNGSTRHVVVTEVGDEQVTVDANHPLAGETLNFDVNVVDVREATSEEIEHGHVH